MKEIKQEAVRKWKKDKKRSDANRNMQRMKRTGLLHIW